MSSGDAYWRNFSVVFSFAAAAAHDKILLAAFVLPFFSSPRQTSQLQAKGSASIQLICQSVWLGLLLLGAARVICKIHCSTISVESCVLAVFSQVRGGKIQRSDWLTNLTDSSLCYCCCCCCFCCCLCFCFLCSCLWPKRRCKTFTLCFSFVFVFFFYCFACELWLEGSLRKST